MSSAPLVPLTLIGPGFYGLNTQTSSNVLGVEWAGELNNFVFDEAGRPACRNGWAGVTTAALAGTPDIEQIFEYIPLSGSNEVVSAADDKIYTGTTTLTDKTGALTVTANNWQFVNFNGNCYGLQADHDLIKYTGTGDFTAVTASSGSVPDGNCLLSAFGRLWGSSADGQVLKYSSALDDADWGGVGAGSFNFTSVWPTGHDVITALASFDNYLVVFGKRNIILLADTTGSTIGLTPSNAIVKKVLSGVGCIARDSVQNIDGDDLVFLSYTGVQSLVRVIQAEGNPLKDVSQNVRDYIVRHISMCSTSTIRSTYSPSQGMYLLLLPGAGYIYYFSTKAELPNGAFRVATWSGFVPASLFTLEDGSTTYSGKLGKIFSYSGKQDNGSTIRLVYKSGWLFISEEVKDYIKILKMISGLFSATGPADVTFYWAFDFNNSYSSFSRQISGLSTDAEYGTSEFGVAEFGGGYALTELTAPTTGSGQFLKIGITCVIDNIAFAVQQLQLFAKIGRLT